MLNTFTQLLFNPFAGAAGFNLVACGVWAGIAMLALCAVIEYKGR